MSSLRTQIYLTREQRRKLDARAQRGNRTLASVIREAVEAYTVEEPADIKVALDATFGALPDLDVPARSEWDRVVG